MNYEKSCLVTGPEIKTWPNNCNLILLGDFCINDSNRGVITNRKYKVVDPYGDNPDTRAKDKKETDNLYEKVLLSVSSYLNINHNVNYPIRYWRILIGPWLNAIIPILYNRWKKIELALASDFDSVSGIKTSENNIIPYDMEDFVYFHTKSEWNSDLFSRILEFKNIECDSVVFKENYVKHVKQNKINRVGKIKKFIQFITSKDNNYFFISSYIERKSLAILQLLLGQFPVFYQSNKLQHIKPSLSLRSRIVFDFQQSNEFEKFVSFYLQYAIPTVYLEGFVNLTKLVNSMPWPKNPRVIFTSNSFFSDEVFNKWTADNILNGTPYIIGQHGGGYGIKEFPQRTELHEQKSADLWLSWGEVEESYQSIVSSTNLKLIGKKIEKINYKNPILLQITDDLFPYSRFPWCSDGFNKVYMDEQVRFAVSLNKDIQRSLVVRLHNNQSSMGNDQKKYWSKKAENIRIDEGFSPINRLVSKSRIIISTYNATSFLETLALDIPTVVFWNMDKSPINSIAKPYFSALEKCGIFHRTPESAAEHVSLIWNDVCGWWESENVQEARKYFCNQFSRNVNNPHRLIYDLVSINALFRNNN